MSQNIVLQKSIIDALIEARTKAEAEKESARVAKLEKDTEKSLERLRANVGPQFYDWMNSVTGAQQTTITNGGEFSWIKIEIPGLDEFQLAPIEIHWERGRGYQPFEAYGYDCKTLDVCLEKARECYPEYRRKRLEEKTDPIAKKLNNYSWGGLKSWDKAQEAFNSLVALDPENESKWSGMLEDWREAANRDLEIERNRAEREAREAEAKALQATQRAEYIEAMTSWAAAYHAAIEFNTAEVARVQAENDDPYIVSKITRGIIAIDEDGNKYADTTSTLVWGDRPEDNGYWIKRDGNRIFFFNIDSIEPIETRPSEGLFSLRISRHGVEIFFSPKATREEIDSALSALVPIPAEPEAPDWLSYESHKRIRRDALHPEEIGTDLDPEFPL